MICDICKERYIEETGEGKARLKDRVRVYGQHFQQTKCQKLEVDEDLRVYGKAKFQIFPLFQMRSKNTNLTWSH